MRELESKATIDALVSRLLQEADALRRFPTPVADLVAVQRLRLARTDESAFSPAVLASAPPELRAKVEAFSPKLVALLDRRERAIHLAPGGLVVQDRFHQCHELGHDLCPWHDERYYLDGAHTLDPAVRALFEREANYAATRLLFQHDLFEEVARGYRMTFAEVKALATAFGASLHATFRLHIERNRAPVAGLILGKVGTGSMMPGEELPVKTGFTSLAFNALFRMRDLATPHLAAQLRTAISDLAITRRPSEGYLHIPARDGAEHSFQFQLATNSYDLFLFLHSPVKRPR